MLEQAQPASAANAVEIEIFKHLFASVAEEMGARLLRSAYSPNIKERRDFSCAVFDSAGEILAQAAHIPVHLGSMPLSLQAILTRFPAESMRPGERFIVNDPFQGGTHLPDITIAAPCFMPGEERPRFFVANRAHHADVGGISAGSMPLSRSIAEEGLLLPPSRLDAVLFETICHASRTPGERRGDLRAQLAALDAGMARLDSLAARYGAEYLDGRGRELADYTERIARGLCRSIPAGNYSFSDVLDGDGIKARDIMLRCWMDVSPDGIVFDLTGSDDQVTGPVNAVRAITLSAVYYALLCLLPPGTPANSGVMRCVRVLTRPGSVLDALPPSAVAAGNVETSQRIVDVLLGCLAQALPGLIPAASQGTMNNVTIGSISTGSSDAGGQTTEAAGPPVGRRSADAATEAAPFAYYETLAGGAGGGPLHAGASAVHVHMTNTLNTPVEALEHAYPLRVEQYALRRGSGGAGLHPGGDGVVRRYSCLAACEVTLLSERREHPPYGLAGGQPGACGVNTLIEADGTRHALPGKCTLTLQPGQQLEIATPGGGGWGGSR